MKKRMTVEKTSVFPAGKDVIFQKLQQVETLQYIARPYAVFDQVDENARMEWRPGEQFQFRFRLFGIVPFGVHHIQVERFDAEQGIFTRESNKHVPVWNHEIVLEIIDETHTRYTDRVEIEAGWKTYFVHLWANLFYAHRQRKWRKLLK